MRSIVPLLVFFASHALSVPAGPVDRDYGSDSASPATATIGRRDLDRTAQHRPLEPKSGRLSRSPTHRNKLIGYRNIAQAYTRADPNSSGDNIDVTTGSSSINSTETASLHPKDGSYGSAKTSRDGYASLGVTSTSTMETHIVKGSHRPVKATPEADTSTSTGYRGSRTIPTDPSEHTVSHTLTLESASTSPSAPSHLTSNSTAAGRDSTFASITDTSFADATGTTSASVDDAPETTDSISNSEEGISRLSESEGATDSGDSQSEYNTDGPAYNRKSLSCSDYLGIHGSAEKWNATDGDNALREFVKMYNSDSLWCSECFGEAKEDCHSEDKQCDDDIRTRSTPDNSAEPNWSVAAALFGQYDKADSFTCRIGPSECASAPECKDLNGGEGAGAAAILQSITNAYLAFQSNYEAVQQAGNECNMQMNLFSDVFAPVPDSENEIIALIILTSLLGGMAAFLGPVGGFVVGTAAGIGSGIGMEKYFSSMPGPQDTSSSLGTILDIVLEAYGNMTDHLFQNGNYTHPTSDGTSDFVITMQNLMKEGQLVKPDSDPKNYFRNMVPTYKRILFQQLALITWTHLQVDGKTHVPFIAFNKGACDQVSDEKEGSLGKAGFDGIETLDVQIDYQGDCYYLLDGVPASRSMYSPTGSCIGKALPGGTNKELTENADVFSELEIADFIIPSVLGWQAHAKTNGYKSAAANGNLIKDVRAPGVVNIPVCDYLTDSKHPGVGCPVIGRLISDTKCDLVGSGEGQNPPGQYSPGGCRAHVTQWQKNQVKNNANQLPDFQLSVDIYDQTNRMIGSATKQSAAKPLEVTDTSLPYNLIIVPGGVDSDPVSFWYADQYWTSKDTGDPHKCQGGDGDDNEYDNGARQMDCAFDCPLPNPNEDAPASATIDHPLPTPAVEAVPGISSYVNTWSKTAGPAPAAETPTYASGGCPMKITQYQKNLKDSNPTNDFQLEISVKDANGGQAASFAKQPCPIGQPMVMQGLKGGDFTITIGKNLDGPLEDSSPISFSWRGEDFDTDTLQCAHGGYENGDRELNCNLNC